MSAFTLNIQAGTTQAASSATGSGSYQEVISDSNAALFGLGDDSTNKDMVNKYFGARPDDLYLHSPTPWDDLYSRYNWPQVQTNLQFVSATVSSFDDQLEAVNTAHLVNTSKKAGTFHATSSKTVQNTTTSSWSVNNSFTIGQKFEYGVSFLGAGGKGESSLSYTHSWGEGGSESTSVTMGNSVGVDVELQPGEAVDVVVMAYAGSMTIDVVYNATLSGWLAINYGDKYNGSHFWGLDVNNVLAANGKPTTIQITQTIKVSYYTSSYVEQRDPSTSTSQTLWGSTDPQPASPTPIKAQPVSSSGTAEEKTATAA